MPEQRAFDDAFAWIDRHPTEYRPTEILLPLALAVGPVWMHQEKRGGWFARVDVTLDVQALLEAASDDFDTGLLGAIAECGHGHESPDEAWACADRMARTIVVGVLDAR